MELQGIGVDDDDAVLPLELEQLGPPRDVRSTQKRAAFSGSVGTVL